MDIKYENVRRIYRIYRQESRVVKRKKGGLTTLQRRKKLFDVQETIKILHMYEQAEVSSRSIDEILFRKCMGITANR